MIAVISEAEDVHSKLVFRRHVGGLSSVSEELLDEVGDVLSGDRDVLDRRSDNVTLGLEGGEDRQTASQRETGRGG